MKKIVKATLFLVCVYLLLCINALGQTSTMMHYEPYSSWAAETGTKYELFFSEKPQREILRWETLNIFADLSDVFEAGNQADKILFKDINELPENIILKIEKAADMGLISGYGDNTFKPFNTVTRAEFVAIMDKFGLLDNIKGKKSVEFEDTKFHWANTYIVKASSAGIVNGKNDSSFCPEETITIEEVLLILDRLVDNNKIKKDELVDTLSTTFYSTLKIPEDKDKYMAYVIYSDINNIQQDMWLYRNTLIGYDYTDIGATLTLEDALIWRHYYGNSSIYDGFTTYLDLNDKEEMNSLFIHENRYHESGVDKYFFMDNGAFDYTRPITLLEFLDAYTKNRNNLEPANVDFANMGDFNDTEKEAIRKAVGVGFLPNSNYDFPGHQYMTKAMLNYITVRVNKISNLFKRSYYLGDKEAYIDENSATWPSNYYLYPYIYRPLENEAYEIPFLNAGVEGSKSPQDVFPDVMHCYKSLQYNIDVFVNNIFNIDYQTIDEQTLYNKIENCYFLRLHKPYIDEYVKYVRDNKIILKGTYKNCLPVLYYDAVSKNYRIRVKINFQIESSDTKENLLFGDLVNKPLCPEPEENYYHTNIIYEDNDYEFYCDFPLFRYDTDDRLALYLPFRISDNIVLNKQGKINSTRVYIY